MSGSKLPVKYNEGRFSQACRQGVTFGGLAIFKHVLQVSIASYGGNCSGE